MFTFLKPPHFSDEDTNHLAQILHNSLLVAIALLSGLIGLRLWQGVSLFVAQNLFPTTLVIIMVALLIVMRGRFVRPASAVFLTLVWLAMLYQAWRVEGIKDTAFIAQVVMIVTASLLVGWRISGLFTLLSILAGWGLVYAQTKGWVQPEVSPPYEFATDISVIFLLVALLAHLTSRRLRRSLALARASEHALEKSNRELHQLRASLEQGILERMADLEAANTRLAQEVAQHQHAEQALRESEERYRTLIENQGEGVGIVDLQERFTFVNPAAERIFGVLPGELVGRNLQDFASPAQFAYLQAQTQLRQQGEKSTYDLEIIRPDGEKRNLLVTGVPYCDNEGQIIASFGVFRDMTAQKQAEEALHQAYRRLDDIIDFLPEATFVIDHEGKVIAWNRAMETLFGITKSEIIGHGDLEYAIPFYGEKKPLLIDLALKPDQEFEEVRYQNVERQGDLLLAEAYMRRAYGGQGAYLWGIATRLRDADGRVVGAIESIRDITERKQTEQTVRDAYRRLKELEDIVSHSQAIAFLRRATAGWPVEYVSNNIQQLGYNPLDFYTKRTLYTSIIHPDDLARVVAEVTRYSQEGCDEFTQEYRLLTPTSEVRWITAHTWIRRETTGAITHYQGIVLDITERKSIEETIRQANITLRQRVSELSTLNRITQTVATLTNLEQTLQVIVQQIAELFEACECAVGILDKERTTQTIMAVYSSIRPVSSLLGWLFPLAADPPGRRVIETGQALIINEALTNPIVAADVRQVVQQYHLQAMMVVPLWARGEIIGTFTLVANQAGRAFTSTEAELAQTVAGQIAGAIANARLFDEMRQARAWAEERSQAAEAANRAKSIFLANMSHELRTPLNGILGYAQILQRDNSLPDHHREAIHTIQQSGEHLLTLINDVLDMSKIEANKLEFSPTEFNLPHFMRHLVGVFHQRAEQKGLNFVYEELSDLPVGVRGDEHRLRQVLINLLGNAVKFTEKGTVALKIGWHFDRLRFQVEDTGVGIAPEDVEAIFIPFHQAGDRQKMIEGTGLGLAICQRLVNLMGGELQVRSVPRQGAVFWFDLALPVVEGWLAPVTDAPQPTVAGYHGPRRKVLVADDKTSNRAIYIEMLAPLGFELTEAADGQEAVRQAQAIKPDIILMDLVMPILDGLAATQQIRQMPELQNIVIIAVSASAFGEDQARSLEVGCNAFIAKPFRLETLLAVIQSHLGLAWIYEDESPPVTLKMSEQKVTPPLEELEKLHKLVLMGKIVELRASLDRLAAQDAGYGPFVAEIRALAQKFQLKAIRKQLEIYFNDPPEK